MVVVGGCRAGIDVSVLKCGFLLVAHLIWESFRQRPAFSSLLLTFCTLCLANSHPGLHYRRGSTPSAATLAGCRVAASNRQRFWFDKHQEREAWDTMVSTTWGSLYLSISVTFLKGSNSVLFCWNSSLCGNAVHDSVKRLGRAFKLHYALVSHLKKHWGHFQSLRRKQNKIELLAEFPRSQFGAESELNGEINVPVSICNSLKCGNCMVNQMELNVIKIYTRLIWSVMVLSMYGVAFL